MYRISLIVEVKNLVSVIYNLVINTKVPTLLLDEDFILIVGMSVPERIASVVLLWTIDGDIVRLDDPHHLILAGVHGVILIISWVVGTVDGIPRMDIQT